jgi:hypothetical protein
MSGVGLAPDPMNSHTISWIIRRRSSDWFTGGEKFDDVPDGRVDADLCLLL